MVSICTHAKTRQFSVDLCTPTLGMLHLFQYHNTRPFTQHKTIPISVPRPTCSDRIVIAS